MRALPATPDARVAGLAEQLKVKLRSANSELDVPSQPGGDRREPWGYIDEVLELVDELRSLLPAPSRGAAIQVGERVLVDRPEDKREGVVLRLLGSDVRVAFPAARRHARFALRMLKRRRRREPEDVRD
jgi:hypothetical protein